MNLYDVFRELNIEFEEIQHEPVFTVEQAKAIENKIGGTGCKNLFLTDKKGKYFLVILEDNKKANVKEISKIVNTSHLSFVDISELKNILQLGEGNVTPFRIINDFDNKVLLMIDEDLKDKKLLFHPNVNNKTISVTYDDLIKFIDFEKHNYINI